MPPPKRPKTVYNARTKSVTTLKKKIRDVQRVLTRPESTLPADLRVENERALAAYKHELAVATKARTEHKLAKKYHMVRFFERKKATRRLNKLQKEIVAHTDGKAPEDLLRRAHDATVELNYTLHYPRGEKYISLFKDPGIHAEVVAKREAIKRDIEKRMAAGTLGAWTTSVGLDEEEEEEKEEKKTQEVTKPKKTKKDKSKGKEDRSSKRKVEPEKEKPANIADDDFFEL